MIEINDIKKSFDGSLALDELSLEMKENEVFGLVGTNGSGKTTLLRLICGIMLPDSGDIKIDGLEVWDNPAAKEKFFMIPDEPYFFPNATARSMSKYYAEIYKDFSMDRFDLMLKDFNLEPEKRISGYSKGMIKQLYIIFGLCANTKYLLCDETFDGLDPLMRRATKQLFAREMVDRGLTPVLTSHSLRELEDICDRVGLLHKGKVLLSGNLSELGDRSLEDYFIEETEVVDYDITNIIHD